MIIQLKCSSFTGLLRWSVKGPPPLLPLMLQLHFLFYELQLDQDWGLVWDL